MSGLENLLIGVGSGAGGFGLGYLTYYLKTRGKITATGGDIGGGAATQEVAKTEKEAYDEIQEIVNAVNLDAYLKHSKAGTLQQYWDTHKRILDGLYEILMEGHEYLWSGYRGMALQPIAGALNGVIETQARPVKITEEKIPDEGKMYFGPGNFVYTWDGLSVVKDGRNKEKKEEAEMVTLYSTVSEFERTIDEKTGKVIDVKFKGIRRTPGGWIDRAYTTIPADYDPKTYRFGDNFETDIMAEMDVRNARNKIFGRLDANNNPIEVGKIAWLNYRLIRAPTPAAVPVVVTGPEKAGGIGLPETPAEKPAEVVPKAGDLDAARLKLKDKKK